MANNCQTNESYQESKFQTYIRLALPVLQAHPYHQYMESSFQQYESEVFVLQNFSKEELETLKEVLSKSKEGIECFFKEGISITQNKFN